MATFRAIETISDVMVRLLQASHDSEDFGGQRLQFAVYQGDDFRNPESGTVTTGVTLFLYRILVNGSMRTPPGRRLAPGRRQRSQLPLDLHYLLTVWAQTPTMQHRIAGWAMRTLEDAPVLPNGVLHGVQPNVFQPDETVEIVVNDLTNEDLFRIWEVLGEAYRLSIPYLVRNVRVESSESVDSGPPVDRRLFDVLENPGETRIDDLEIGP